ncbi:MAG: hypothetical protein ABR590_03305 [Spirochaetia bacterium]
MKFAIHVLTRTLQSRLIPGVLLLLFPFTAMAVTPEEFRELVAFGVTIEALAESANTDPDSLLNDDRVFIIDGVLGSVTIIDDNPDTYLVQLEMVDGRWHGTQRIDVFRVYVLAEGPEYQAHFPARPSPDAGDTVIQRNERVLIAARVADIFEDELGGRYAVLSAQQLRVVR